MGRKFEVRKESMMKTGLQKGKLYARFGKEIYMCAKSGGPNLDANLALKHLIERAKKQQVPMDIIKRNIDKASGASAEDYTAIRYEGFGPGGSAWIVDTLTDNVNRTISEVRSCFTKVGAKLGVNGSVEHMYEHVSYVTIKGLDIESVLELLFSGDVDVTDIEETDGTITITADGYALDKVETILREHEAIDIITSEQGWYAHESNQLDDQDYALFEKLLNGLNDLDDVQNIYHNVIER